MPAPHRTAPAAAVRGSSHRAGGSRHRRRSPPRRRSPTRGRRAPGRARWRPAQRRRSPCGHGDRSGRRCPVAPTCAPSEPRGRLRSPGRARQPRRDRAVRTRMRPLPAPGRAGGRSRRASAVGAAHDLPVAPDRSADAGSDGDVQRVAVGLSGTVQGLADRHHPHVVVHHDGTTAQPLELATDVGAGPTGSTSVAETTVPAVRSMTPGAPTPRTTGGAPPVISCTSSAAAAITAAAPRRGVVAAARASTTPVGVTVAAAIFVPPMSSATHGSPARPRLSVPITEDRPRRGCRRSWPPRTPTTESAAVPSPARRSHRVDATPP